MRAILALTLLSTCAAVWAQVPDGVMYPEQVAPTASVTTMQIVETRPHVQLRPLTTQEEADVRAYMQKYTPGIVKYGDDPRAVEDAIRFLLGIDQSHDTPLTRRPKEYEADWQTATQLLNRTRWLGSVNIPQPQSLPPFEPSLGAPPIEPTELAELPEIPGLTILPAVWLDQVSLDCRPAPAPCPPPACHRPAGALYYGYGGGRAEANIGYAWGSWRHEPENPGGTCPPGKPPEPPSPGQVGGGGNGDPSGPGQGGPGGYEPQDPPPTGYDPGIPGNGGPGNNPPPPATPGQGGGDPPPPGGGGAHPAP